VVLLSFLDFFSFFAICFLLQELLQIQIQGADPKRATAPRFKTLRLANLQGYGLAELLATFEFLCHSFSPF
jgi:hypothetical protein